MKKSLLLLFLLLGSASFIHAKKAYAELLGFQKGLFSNKVKVYVDFGQNVSFWKRGDMVLVDDNGKDIVFNSMVDAMNFMGGNGWEFVQAYVVTEGNQNVYHWLMTKEVNSDDDIKAGFNVRADVRESDLPTYSLTFLRKKKSSSQWETVKTDVRKLKEEDLKALIDDWKSQSSETMDYDCQVKKE